jgi:hypothetical protein
MDPGDEHRDDNETCRSAPDTNRISRGRRAGLDGRQQNECER